MALNLPAIQIGIDVDNKQAISGLNSTEKHISTFQSNSSSTFQKFGKAAAVIGTAVATATAAAATALFKFTKDGIQYASDLAESQNVVDVTFKNNADTINKWAKTASEAYGLNELQAKKMTGTMGAMLSSMGLADDQVLDMSTSLTGLSADFASFYNLNSQEAFDKIRAGISGETEPLKQLGINMSVANIEAFALQKGLLKTVDTLDNSEATLIKIERAQAKYNEAVKKHGKDSLEARDAALQLEEAQKKLHTSETQKFADLSANEQAMVRYQYLLEASADAQGDFARTSDSFSNQQRILQNNLQALSGTIGAAVLPVINQLVQVVNKLISSGAFDGLINMLSTTLVPALAQIGGMLAEMLPGFIQNIQPLLQQIITLVTSTINTILPILLPIIQDILPIFVSIINNILTALQPLLPVFGDLIVAILPLLEAILKPLMPLLTPIIEALVEILSAVIPPLSEVINVLAQDVLPPLIDIFVSLVNLALKNVIDTFNSFKPVIDNVVEHIRLMVQFFQQIFSGDFSGAFETMKSIGQNALNTLGNIFTGAVNNIKSIFSNVYDTFKEPLNKAWQWVQNTWSKVAELLTKPIRTAKETLSGIIDTIKGFFSNMKLPEFKLPKIKLPHFKITGSFSLAPPSMPRLSVDWYAKGGIFNRPSIIGVGEAGTEAVVPIDKLPELLSKAGAGGGVTMNNTFYVNDKAMADYVIEQLYKKEQQAKRQRGFRPNMGYTS